MTKYAQSQKAMQRLGELDFLAGKPITEFPGGGERKRAAYELGWRCAKHEFLATQRKAEK